MVIVSKFGGSSCADASQFKKVKDIVESNKLRKVVVVSALGKRQTGDNKITDLLYLLAAHMKYGVDGSHIWDTIYQRYDEIKNELHLKINLEKEFKVIRENLEERFDENYLVSRGEYLCAKLMSEYLGYKFVDAIDLFCFDYDGTIDMKKTVDAMNSKIMPQDKIVVPGFYGRNPNGTIRLFSRGGSDVTGSLLASGLQASTYENWTDVSGILMADPKLISNPKKIKYINYDELRELSYMGASVLHEETIFPIQDLNIPIQILNTNAPNEEGTVITNNAQDTSNLITGIAGKKNYTSITIVKEKQSDKLHVISEVLRILEKYRVSIEHIPTSIDSFSVVIETKAIEEKVFEIIGEIKNLKEVSNVSVDNDIALVAIVGRNMVTKPGISGRIFGVVGSANINIKMIAQGAKELTIILGISNKDFEKTIIEIYNNMIEKKA